MTFMSLLGNLSAKIRPGRLLINTYLLDEQAFQHEAIRERMRVDRNGSPLAVLIIAPRGRQANTEYEFLANLLVDRLRMTDTTGWLSGRRIGVLLPDTSKQGAWKIAGDLCDAYPQGSTPPDFEVHSYPEDSPSWNGELEQVEEQPASESTSSSFEGLFSCRMPTWKRAFDVLGAGVGLALATPLIFVLGVAVKLSSRGPVFFTQQREGLGGKRFWIHKLRTMRTDADRYLPALRAYNEQDGPAFKMRHDPRVTKLGEWLRWSSLDELPQLWNVLRGDMSLVGPRPLPIEESQQCSPWQRRRLSVTPGLTCLWQVKGRNRVSFDEWMRMDIRYAQRRTLGNDLSLIIRTLPSLLFHVWHRYAPLPAQRADQNWQDAEKEAATNLLDA